MGETANSRRNGLRWEDSLAFFLGFVRHPRLVASVVPSSRFLTRRLASFVTSSKPPRKFKARSLLGMTAVLRFR